MAVDVILLRLGSTTMESAVVLEWFANVGDEVSDGDPIVSLETDKVEIDLPAPASGFLLRVFAAPGDQMEVGSRLAEIGTQQELDAVAASPEVDSGVVSPAAFAEAAADPEDPPSPTVPVAAPGDAPRAAPPARRLAMRLGIDLATVAGTGPGGRIQSADVQAVHDAGSAAARSEDGTSDVVRRRIAARMSRSMRETAPVTLNRQVKAGRLTARAVALKETSNEEESRPSVEDMIIQVVAAVLRDTPALNGSWIEDRLQPNGDININFAVQGPRGLVVPVIARADELDLPSIASERRRLTALALDGGLRPDDVADGTFTITNLGAFGIDTFTPIITLPQVAVLGVGRIADTVLPVGRGLVVEPMLWLSLTFDHRAIDGAPAAEFLGAIAHRIEKLPES